MTTNWLYKTNEDNSARFVLGQPGTNNLICFGVNPSTAEPNTLRRVKNFAKIHDYDDWIMLNLYPQRDTEPEQMHEEKDTSIFYKNLDEIRSVITHYNGDLLAAWGVLGLTRQYLSESIQIIEDMTDSQNWKHLGNLTKDGHPRHPSYLSGCAMLHEFEFNNYLRDLLK